MKILLESQYFPPIQYFSKYFISNEIYIDPNRPFLKQSYRNRCRILGPNKVLDLIIPLKKGKNQIPHKDVFISDDHKWRREHLRAIESSYGKSPFFEHYYPQIEALIKEPETNLFAFTQSTIRWLENQLGLSSHKLLDPKFEQEKLEDLRDLIHPKSTIADPLFAMKAYWQCFDHAGFSPNLSVIDLLFNEGPAAAGIIAGSVKKQ